MKRICYGISLPGLFVTITIYLHVSDIRADMSNM
jgi:hypothetical protein